MKKTETSFKHQIRTPWHLWFIAIFFIFLSSQGVYDYFMTLGLNSDYFSSQNYGEAHITYFTNYPIVPAAFWTIGISSGLIAPILLLFRLRWAVQVALISVVSQLCLDILTFGFRGRWQVFGPWISLFDILILLLTFGLFLYCRSMSARGVLR